MTKDNLLHKLVKIFTKTKNVFIGVVVEWSLEDGVLLAAPNKECCRILSLSDIEAYTFISEQDNILNNEINQIDNNIKPETLIKNDSTIKTKSTTKSNNYEVCSLLELRQKKAELELKEYKQRLKSNEITKEGTEYGSQYSALLQLKNNPRK